MQKNLTSGSIRDHLIKISLPMIFSIFAAMSFNLVDTYFIGKLGVDQLAALSFSFPVVLTIMNLAIGLAVGTASVLARMLGEGLNDQVKVISTLVTFSAIVIGATVTTIGIATVEPVFTFLGATKIQVQYASGYMQYAYPSMGLRLIAISISGTYRANGITLIPSISMLTATLLNFGLDPLFIFGGVGIPAMGIEGAALATLFANALALLFEFYMAAFRYKFFTLKFNDLPWKKLKEIISIAAPASFANALNPIALNIGNFLISKQFSSLSVAGFGVATKIQFFSMIPVLALSAGVGPVVGQNLGANQFDRVNKAMKLSFNFCLLWGALQAAVLWFGAEPLSYLFTDNKETVEFCMTYLHFVGWSLFGYSIVIIGSAILNAINKPLFSFLMIFLRAIGLFLLIYFVLNIVGVDHSVIYAIAITNCMVGLAAGSYFKTFKLSTN